MGGGGSGNSFDLGYQAKELPAIGGVAGATTLGFWALSQTGALATTTTMPAIFTSQAAAAQATQGATAYHLFYEGDLAYGTVTTQSISPAMQAFGGGLVGASLALAAVSIIIAVSGIGAGLGPAGTYFYMGAGAVGGAMTGIGIAGMPSTFAAGSAIPAGTELAGGSMLAAGSNLGPGTYSIAGMTQVVPEGGSVVAAETATVTSETAAVSGGGATAAEATTTGEAATASTPGIAGASTLLAVGIVILVIVIIMLILNIVMGVGDMKKVEVSAECKPWQPPIGVNNDVCNQCGQDGFPCNDYACSSLGASCKLVGEHPNVVCEDMSPDDVSSPVISVNEQNLQDNFEINSISDSGFKLDKTDENSKCLEDFESVIFSVTTDEYAWCKLSLNPETKFEDMIYLGGDNALRKEHFHTISSLEIINYFNDIGQPLPDEKEADVNLYALCQDAKGNVNPSPYIISLCVFKIDLTPPILTYIDFTNGYLPYKANETKVVVRSNEPVELKWSSSDVDFDKMENRFVCPISESITDCWINLPIESDETTVYVRGKDHPEWIGTDRESERNTNEQSLIITLRKTATLFSMHSACLKSAQGSTKTSPCEQTYL